MYAKIPQSGSDATACGAARNIKSKINALMAPWACVQTNGPEAVKALDSLEVQAPSNFVVPDVHLKTLTDVWNEPLMETTIQRWKELGLEDCVV
jgi:hypothetical protein